MWTSSFKPPKTNTLPLFSRRWYLVFTSFSIKYRLLTDPRLGTTATPMASLMPLWTETIGFLHCHGKLVYKVSMISLHFIKAKSTSCPQWSCIVIAERPSRVTDEVFFIPSKDARPSSKGVVTSFSISFTPRPAYSVITNSSPLLISGKKSAFKVNSEKIPNRQSPKIKDRIESGWNTENLTILFIIVYSPYRHNLYSSYFPNHPVQMKESQKTSALIYFYFLFLTRKQH